MSFHQQNQTTKSDIKMTPKTRPSTSLIEKSTSKLKNIRPITSFEYTVNACSPKLQTVKSRAQNYFHQTNNHSTKSRPQLDLSTPKKNMKRMNLTSEENAYKTLPQFAKVLQIQTSKSEKFPTQLAVDETFSVQERLETQLKLEVQSRIVFQTQVKDLQQQILDINAEKLEFEEKIHIMTRDQQSLQQRISQYTKQTYESKANNQNQDQKLVSENNKKYEKLQAEYDLLKNHLQVSLNQNKNFEMELQKQGLRQMFASPSRSAERVKRPTGFQDQNLQKQNLQLENKLEQSQKNKQNIEKVLEVKLAEQLEKEKYLLEKISRLEQQLRSRMYFEQEKRQQKHLEQQLLELNQSLRIFKKQVKDHNASTELLKKQNQNQSIVFQNQIKQQSILIKQYEADLKKQIQPNRSSQSSDIVKKDQTSKKDTEMTKQIENFNQGLDSLNEDQKSIQKYNTIQSNITENQQIKDKEMIIQNQLTQIECLQKQLSEKESISNLKNESQEEQNLNHQVPNQQSDIHLKTLEVDIKILRQQVAIMERVNIHWDTSWISELNLIKTQAHEIDNKLQLVHLDDNKSKDLFELEERNYNVTDQLNSFEGDINDGLCRQIQETKKFLQDLNSLIMGQT